MMTIGIFPFGQPVQEIVQTNRSHKQVFVLGVYASAVHARWIGIDNKTKEYVMDQEIKLFVYPVKDLAKAKALFSKLLGVAPYADASYYVGFRVGEQEIGLDPNRHSRGMMGPIGYWEVADIKKSLQSLLDAGAQLHQAVTVVGGGKLIALVKDADGNILGLMQLP